MIFYFHFNSGEVEGQDEGTRQNWSSEVKREREREKQRQREKFS